MKQYIIRISVITILAVAVLFTALSLLLVRQEQDLLYRELIGSRKISLDHLVSNAVMPLLDDDALSLNSLLKEPKTVDGFVYAMIIDQKGVVRAHTDVARLGSEFGGFQGIRDRKQEGETRYVTYGLSPQKTILDISRPVVFMKRELGRVHLGFSSGFIKHQLAQNKAKSIQTLLLWGLAMMAVLIISATLLSIRLGRSDSPQIRKPKRQNMWGPSGQGTFPQTGTGDSPDQGPKGSEDGQAGAQPQDMARNQVTVLFAGIKGFKTYAQTREPAKLMEDLNEYVSIATECILRYGGYVDKFIGDAVIAVFASSPLEANHAERAIDAATEMQGFFHKNPNSDNQLLSRVGIGISSGIVLSGTIGTEVKKELAFIGESFKVAYSLNVMAGPGEIIVSRDAYQLLKNRISVEPLPPRELMKRTQSWENFRLIKKK